MKKPTQFQTFRLMAAFVWLFLAPLTSRLVAQSFYTAAEALQEADYQTEEIQSLSAQGLRLIPKAQESLEDGDFRAQETHFRKLHELLNDIGNEAVAMGRSADAAERLDPRLDLSAIREAGVYAGTNADFATLALMDVAQALHEGDLAQAEYSLKEAANALRAIHAFGRVAQDWTQAANRSF